MYAPQGGSCGVFFCLSVLCHNHGCEGGSVAAGRRSVAWPPHPFPGASFGCSLFQAVPAGAASLRGPAAPISAFAARPLLQLRMQLLLRCRYRSAKQRQKNARAFFSVSNVSREARTLDTGPPQERNTSCTNRQICARGVFRSQTARPFSCCVHRQRTSRTSA